MPSWLPIFGQSVDSGLERLAVDNFGIKPLRAPEAHLFVLRMGRIADGIEVFGIARRAADVFRGTAAGGLEQEGKLLCRRVVEPFFKLDYMVPAVAKVVEIMDRFGAGLSNDVAEARLAGIDGLVAVIVVGIRNSPMNIASEELEEVAVRPAKRRLKRIAPARAALRGAMEGEDIGV